MSQTKERMVITIKFELINKEDVIKKIKINDISLTQLTTFKILLDQSIENDVKNKTTVWLDGKIISL